MGLKATANQNRNELNRRIKSDQNGIESVKWRIWAGDVGRDKIRPKWD